MTENTTGGKSRFSNLNSTPSFPAYVPPSAVSETEPAKEENEYDQAETNSSGYANVPENHQNGVAPADHGGIINTTPGEVEQEKPAKPSKGTKAPKGGADKPETSKEKPGKAKKTETKEKETEMPVAVAPKKQSKAVPTPASKPGAKGKPAPVAKNGGPTIRQRVFELLAKSPEGLTGRAIAEKLSLKGIPNLLKDEGVCEKPRIKRMVVEGVRGVTYVLTAAGKNDLAKGKVDENAAPSSSGVEW